MAQNIQQANTTLCFLVAVCSQLSVFWGSVQSNSKNVSSEEELVNC
jgi:hypothetical protein